MNEKCWGLLIEQGKCNMQTALLWREGLHIKSALPDEKLREFVIIFRVWMMAHVQATVKIHRHKKVYCRFPHSTDCQTCQMSSNLTQLEELLLILGEDLASHL